MNRELLVEAAVWAAGSTIIVGTAGVLAKLFKRSSAAIRHGVWLAAFVTLLLFPVARWVLPKSSVIVSYERPEVLATVPPASVEIRPSPATMPDRFEPAGSRSVPIDSTISLVDNQPSPELAAAVVPHRSFAFGTFPWACAVVILWAGGAGACAIQILIAIRRLRRIRTRVADRALRAETTRCADLLGIRLHWRLRLNEGHSPKVAMTWGMKVPTVLLPASAPAWEPQRLEAVMLHELAHVRRRDSASQVVAAVVCALYWFNPLVWLGARALRAEAECAADDLVLGSGIKPSTYAGELLRMAAELGNKSQPLSVAGVPLMKHSKIESRVVAILDNSRRRRAAGSLELLGAIGIAMVAGLPFAILKPTIASSPTTAIQVPGDPVEFSNAQDDLAIASAQSTEKNTASPTIQMVTTNSVASTKTVSRPENARVKALSSANAALSRKLRSRIPIVLSGYGSLRHALVNSLDAATPRTLEAQRELNHRLRRLWAWFGSSQATKSGKVPVALTAAILESVQSRSTTDATVIASVSSLGISAKPVVTVSAASLAPAATTTTPAIIATKVQPVAALNPTVNVTVSSLLSKAIKSDRHVQITTSVSPRIDVVTTNIDANPATVVKNFADRTETATTTNRADVKVNSVDNSVSTLRVDPSSVDSRVTVSTVLAQANDPARKELRLKIDRLTQKLSLAPTWNTTVQIDSLTREQLLKQLKVLKGNRYPLELRYDLAKQGSSKEAVKLRSALQGLKSNKASSDTRYRELMREKLFTLERSESQHMSATEIRRALDALAKAQRALEAQPSEARRRALESARRTLEQVMRQLEKSQAARP